MNRIAVGILVGGALGIVDGLTAWFTPEARPQMIGIVIGSTIKGLVAGAIIGAFAQGDEPAVGAGVRHVRGRAARLRHRPHRREVLPGDRPSPGSLVGLLTGYATIRFGRAPSAETSS